jgi:catechol 2,3-dioxygenase
MGLHHAAYAAKDIDATHAFYTEVMGFKIMQRWGNSAAFLSSGNYHHHLGLNTWESRGGPPSPRRAAGLYHFAILYPNRVELARALKRIVDHGWEIDGAADHGVSEAIYLHDPDLNGIEIYRDRPMSEWPRDPNGEIAMMSDPLDLVGLLGELEREAQPQ